MGFFPVAQAGLELLNSSDPPALVSQSARIPGVSHHVQSDNKQNSVRQDGRGRSMLILAK